MPRPQGGRGGLPHLGPSFATPGNHTPPGRTGTKTPGPWRKAGQCLEGAQEPRSCALSLTRLMGHPQQSQETNCLSNALIKIQQGRALCSDTGRTCNTSHVASVTGLFTWPRGIHTVKFKVLGHGSCLTSRTEGELS